MRQYALLFAFLLAVGVWTGVVAQDRAGEEPLPKAIRWVADYESALAAAAESHKPVMLDFAADWCGFCKKMDREVLSKPDIIRLSLHFEAARVDADKRKDLLEKYSIEGLPTYVFVDAKGQVLHRVVGYTPVAPFSVQMKLALAVFKATPEREQLTARWRAGAATPEELARVAYLLRQAGQTELARAAVNDALQALPADSPLRAGVVLDKWILAAEAEEPGAASGLEKWVAANPDHDRYWEARYEAGLAQTRSHALALAKKTFDEVAKGAPGTDWGIMAAYYAALIGPQLAKPRSSG